MASTSPFGDPAQTDLSSVYAAYNPQAAGETQAGQALSDEASLLQAKVRELGVDPNSLAGFTDAQLRTLSTRLYELEKQWKNTGAYWSKSNGSWTLQLPQQAPATTPPGGPAPGGPGGMPAGYQIPNQTPGGQTPGTPGYTGPSGPGTPNQGTPTADPTATLANMQMMADYWRNQAAEVQYLMQQFPGQPYVTTSDGTNWSTDALSVQNMLGNAASIQSGYETNRKLWFPETAEPSGTTGAPTAQPATAPAQAAPAPSYAPQISALQGYIRNLTASGSDPGKLATYQNRLADYQQRQAAPAPTASVAPTITQQPAPTTSYSASPGSVSMPAPTPTAPTGAVSPAPIVSMPQPVNAPGSTASTPGFIQYGYDTERNRF